jgi:hypothetical protein
MLETKWTTSKVVLSNIYCINICSTSEYLGLQAWATIPILLSADAVKVSIRMIWSKRKSRSNWHKEEVHAHVQSSTGHNSQELQAAQVSSEGWMDKRYVAHIHNEIVFSLQKKYSLTYAAMWRNLRTLCWL